jgi:hypothetical protein
MTDLARTDSRIDEDLSLFIAESLPVVRFELRQLQAGGAETRVRDVRPAEGESVSAIAERVWSLACKDASALTGVNAYALCAYKPDASAFDARHAFRVPVTRTNDTIEPTEPASIAGLMAQLMRHNEASVRSAVLGSGDLIRMLQLELKQSREYIRKLEARSVRAFELVEDLMSAKATRDLAERREARKDAAQAHVIAQVTRYLPALVDRALVATGMVKEGQAPASNAQRLGAVVRSLEEKEVTEIYGILGETRGKELFQILQSVLADEEAADPKPQNGVATHGPS